MSPDEFIVMQRRWGWEMQAARAWRLRPCEVAALAQMVFRPGQVFSLAEFAAYHSVHGRCSGSDGAVRKRIERVRAKLDDIGLGDCIETLPGQGYAISGWRVRKIQTALMFAYGVAEAA